MRILRNLFLLMLFVLLLAVALLALFPAKLALQWVAPNLGSIQLDDVSGTIWNGRAGRLAVHQTELGALQWTLHPASLLSRRADIDLSLDGSEYRGQAFVRLLDGGTLALKDARIEFPAERLNAALDVPGLMPQGKVEVRLDEAELVAGFPRRLKGEAVWRNAAVAGEAAAEFGDLMAEFSTMPGGKITGIAKDLGGPLRVEGSFELGITGFDAEAILAARDGNPQVVKALGWIGEQQPDGSSLLKITGTLLPVR